MKAKRKKNGILLKNADKNMAVSTCKYMKKKRINIGWKKWILCLHCKIPIKSLAMNS